jgi:hypothetical protein
MDGVLADHSDDVVMLDGRHGRHRPHRAQRVERVEYDGVMYAL